MKCKDCPGLKLDGFWHCLLVYPFKPAQLVDENEEADYCKMWETYSAFNNEATKQITSGEKFDENY